MKSTGECKFCKKMCTGLTMTRHLQSCARRVITNELDRGRERVFLIRAGSGQFWIYFEVNDSSTLRKIDGFLRNLWLECCGYMSAFIIRNINYYSHRTLELGGRTMNVPIKHIIRPGLEFMHEYDFGTTTRLRLKCISERKGNVDGIDIIARNDLPDFKCHKCGKPATEICSQCVWEGERSFLCKECAKKHECGEDMLLPFVNSPRAGLCGYTGED